MAYGTSPSLRIFLRSSFDVLLCDCPLPSVTRLPWFPADCNHPVHTTRQPRDLKALWPRSRRGACIPGSRDPMSHPEERRVHVLSSPAVRSGAKSVAPQILWARASGLKTAAVTSEAWTSPPCRVIPFALSDCMTGPASCVSHTVLASCSLFLFPILGCCC